MKLESRWWLLWILPICQSSLKRFALKSFVPTYQESIQYTANLELCFSRFEELVCDTPTSFDHTTRPSSQSLAWLFEVRAKKFNETCIYKCGGSLSSSILMSLHLVQLIHITSYYVIVSLLYCLLQIPRRLRCFFLTELHFHGRVESIPDSSSAFWLLPGLREFMGSSEDLGHITGMGRKRWMPWVFVLK